MPICIKLPTSYNPSVVVHIYGIQTLFRGAGMFGAVLSGLMGFASLGDAITFGKSLSAIGAIISGIGTMVGVKMGGVKGNANFPLLIYNLLNSILFFVLFFLIDGI